MPFEELLGRAAKPLDGAESTAYLAEKTVLVTGAGGSIGSELCRQVAAARPVRLILFDIYENHAYELEQELRAQADAPEITVLIGSVRDARRMESIFARYRPEIVFHAAAHKHVPLMEQSPHEAVKNNVFGTLNTARAADKYGTERFVLISTDKAVNPTSVMGASKRLCEMILQALDRRSATAFSSVRFGNVLGSSGSVVPLFERQIAAGGPVLVTHAEATRYLLTIPEAVARVLEAGALTHGGEIFVLDMGEPVRVLDLAEKMIRAAGLVPYEDIAIRFTGLRPGEKLTEELIAQKEHLAPTEHPAVFVSTSSEGQDSDLLESLEKLRTAAEDEDCDLRPHLRTLVPTYKV